MSVESREGLFKRILVPISSEFYSKEAVRRGFELARLFNCSVTIAYIIEEKTLYQTERLSEAHRTFFDKTETHKDIMKAERRAAEVIVEDALSIVEEKPQGLDKKILYGEFSDVIYAEVDQQGYDLVVIGYEKGCLLNYRLIDSLNTPVWIESGSPHKNIILAVCSNLAPNQKVPNLSMVLSKVLNWDLYMIYVVDTEDTVEVDVNGFRSPEKSISDLMYTAERFSEEMKKKGLEVTIVKGGLEHEIIKAAKKLDAGLVVVGRQRKEKGKLGLPLKHVRRRLAEKCRYSLLFVN